MLNVSPENVERAAMAVDRVEEEPSLEEILARVGRQGGVSYVDMLAHMGRQERTRPAAVFGERTCTYRDTLTAVAAAADYLDELGIEPGDHVACKLGASFLSLTMFLAVWAKRAVLVPIHDDLTGALLGSKLARTRSRLFFVDPGLNPDPDSPDRAMAGPGTLVLEAPAVLENLARREGDIDALLARARPDLTEPALIMSTSGTTGEPKLVVWRQRKAVEGLLLIHKWGIPTPANCFIPTSWGHGILFRSMEVAFWSGGTITMPARFSASRFWRQIAEAGCNYTHIVGTMAQMLLAQPARPDDHDNPLDFVVSSGMSADLWEQFERRFQTKVFEIFGSTDNDGHCLSNPGRYPIGSIGRPWREAQAILVDEAGREVPAGDVGELLMRTPGMPPDVTYLDDPGEGRLKTRDGWVHFGDTMRRDEDGLFYFVDRKSELIRRRGINIAPVEIEALIRQCPGVDLVAAIGVPAELGEHEIKLVLVGAIAGPDVVEYCRVSLPRYMMPRYVEIVDELPLTPGSAKVQKYALRAGWRTASTWDARTEAFLTEALDAPSGDTIGAS